MNVIQRYTVLHLLGGPQQLWQNLFLRIFISYLPARTVLLLKINNCKITMLQSQRGILTIFRVDARPLNITLSSNNFAVLNFASNGTFLAGGT